MANIVALLDSMWGWGGYHEAGVEAPRYFKINPDNHSGKRLARLCGNHSLLVTNSCRLVQSHANAHGIPDIEWVKENLKFLHQQEVPLFLICGRVAQDTFRQATSRSSDLNFAFQSGRFYIGPGEKWARFLMIDHPAARRWSNAKLDATAAEIQRLIG